MGANRELKYENSPKKKKKKKKIETDYCGRLVLTSEGEAAV